MSAVTDGAGLAGGLDRRVRASVPRLRLEASPEAGRFLVVTEALEAGCAVWTEAPLAWAPRLSSTPSNAALCHHCFARAEKPQRCSACHSTQFCSRACQVQSWGRYHKLECARVLNWKSEGRQRSLLSPTILLAARIAFTRAMGADKAKDLPSGAGPVQWTLEQWGELGDHLDQFSAERKAQLAQAAAIAADFVGTELAESTELGPKVFYRWLALFHCNNLSISDPESKEVGIGCYPLTALLNHSCAPNCAVIFVPASEPPSTNPSDPATQCGVLARVRTLRRIAAGETLSIAYIDVAASASVRRSQLRREYFFDCACPRCADPAESARDAVLDGFRCSRPKCASELALVAAKTGDGGPAAQGAEDGQDPLLMCAACQHVYPKADLLAAQHEATRALAKAYLAMGLPSTSVLSAYLPPSAAEDPPPPTPGPSAPSDQRALVGSAVRLLSAVLHPRHTLILRALDLSLRLSLQLEDWRAAEHAARELLPRYEFAYPPGHPLVTLHLLTLGKLLHLLGRSDTKEAAESLARAAEGCRRVFGSGHPMAREADRLAGEAAAEHAAQLRGGMFDA